MRQAHPTGECLFVGYAGQAVEIGDGFSSAGYDGNWVTA
jgi:hypothetical protein